MFEIYLLVNLINGKVYVGQSKRLKTRWYEHRYDAERGRRKPLYDAMRKYGISNFEISTIETVNSKEEADESEIFWVEFYGATQRGYGYNLARGGGGANGYKHSKEYCIQLGNRRRGVSPSDSTREKIRLAASQHRHGPQAKAKLSALRGEIANHFDATVSTDEVIRLRSEGLSYQKIAEALGTGASLVAGRIRASSLPPLPNKTIARKLRLIALGKEHLINPDNSELAGLYLEQEMNCKNIGLLYEMSEHGVSWRLRKFGVKMRPKFGNKPTASVEVDSQSVVTSS